MMLHVWALGLSVLAGAAGADHAQATEKNTQPDVNSLSWMVGNWLEKKGNAETEEHWIAPKGGNMLGLGRLVRGGRVVEFEFLRIAQTAAGISYFASPHGRPAVEFPMVEAAPKRVVFENLKHDFPQRITYWLESEGTLRGRIDGEIKGQKRSKEWQWQKVGG